MLIPMGYKDLSLTDVITSLTDMIMSNKVGYVEARCGINPVSNRWLLDKYFILSKDNFS